MTSIIHIVGCAVDGGQDDLCGKYVKSYDPNGMDGHGVVIGTRERGEALEFRDAGEALTFWRQTSSVRPVRPDGKPNRPLTAYHVEIMPAGAEPLPIFEGGTG